MTSPLVFCSPCIIDVFTCMCKPVHTARATRICGSCLRDHRPQLSILIDTEGMLLSRKTIEDLIGNIVQSDIWLLNY